MAAAAGQIRVSVPPADQPTYHLVQEDILNLPLEAIVLQLDANFENDVLAVNRRAWWDRIGPIAQPDVLALIPWANSRTRAFTGRGGTLGGQPGADFPIMVIAARLDEPPALLPPNPAAPMGVGRLNPDADLRRLIWRILNRAFRNREGLDDDDALVPPEEHWRLRAPTSIGIPLVGCRSDFGYANAAENIVSAIAGWYRSPARFEVHGTPEARLAAIPHVYLVVPPRNRKSLFPARVQGAWEKAWDRYIQPPPPHARPRGGMRSEANRLRQMQRTHNALIGHAPAINDGSLVARNDFATAVGGIPPEFPLNLNPWPPAPAPPELVTADWMSRNYRTFRRQPARRSRRPES